MDKEPYRDIENFGDSTSSLSDDTKGPALVQDQSILVLELQFHLAREAVSCCELMAGSE